MAPAADAPKLNGIVEADETYVGGKPRNRNNHNPDIAITTRHRGRGTKKTPVFAVVERGGRVRARVIATVTAKTLKTAIRENVDEAAIVNTDGLPSYNGLRGEFAGHWVVEHRTGEYARGRAHTNTIEGFFSILKRGINGVYHNVSKAHLHRYLAKFEFRYNGRKLNDGEQVVAAIEAAEGKRLMYRASVAKPAPDKGEWRDSLFD
jgi:transposase-like protein